MHPAIRVRKRATLGAQERYSFSTAVSAAFFSKSPRKARRRRKALVRTESPAARPKKVATLT
jgi:hypothetical protein